MAFPSTFLALTLFLLSIHIDAKEVIIPEDGYTITTVFDGHKPHIYPCTLLQKPSSSQLILLDSVNSTFYTVQFPISEESVFTRFSGDGSVGYVDGDVGSARFDEPKSFAFDLRGNVYVADKTNRAIRKISAGGVTTIAGGRFSEKSSRKEGPALNASFSNDFDLTFIPGLCALLVSDHMHQLVRQINLKDEDCTLGSKSGLGAVITWTIGLGFSCLLGLVIGIVVRPYIIPNKGTNPCHFIETWKHYLTNLGKLLLTHFFGIKSAVASCSCSSVYIILMRLWSLCLSHLVLMFRINIVSTRPHLESVSLLDLDACNSGEVTRSSKYHDQLKDLMSFDEDFMESSKAIFNKGYYDSKGRSAVFHEAEVNMGFEEAPEANIHQESSVCNLGIVKRR